jgi:hypothetical protein
VERTGVRVLQVAECELHLEKHDDEDREGHVGPVAERPADEREDQDDPRHEMEDVPEVLVRLVRRRPECAASREVHLDEDPGDEDPGDGEPNALSCHDRGDRTQGQDVKSRLRGIVCADVGTKRRRRAEAVRVLRRKARGASPRSM